jgi:hypothetical protein
MVAEVTSFQEGGICQRANTNRQIESLFKKINLAVAEREREF